ncbi:MAG: hypothetical protein U0X93_00990 [Anaerolineales bacterium]
MLTYVHSVEESKALNKRTDPMVISSLQAPAETGRILHHLRNNIENPKNTVCIVSWQAPYTLGRRIADREKQIKIFGEPYSVKAEVATIGGLSGHAGQDLLVKYATTVENREEDFPCAWRRKICHTVHGPSRARRRECTTCFTPTCTTAPIYKL